MLHTPVCLDKTVLRADVEWTYARFAMNATRPHYNAPRLTQQRNMSFGSNSVSMMNETSYPDGFLEFIDFMCKKYELDRSRLFIDYSTNHPPPVKGRRPGYYDGLLSFREKEGHPEFLITVFDVSRNPLLTLAHELVHLVRDLKLGTMNKDLGPPNDRLEREIDEQALRDLSDFRASRNY